MSAAQAPASVGAVTVERKAIVDALARLAPAIPRPRRGAPPALRGVKIEAREGAVTFRASDLDVWLGATVPANVADEFDAVIHHATLSKLLRWATEPITLGPARDGVIDVSFGSTRAALHTMPDDEFPRTPEPPDGAEHVDLTADDIDAIRRVANFASADGCRPILTGVLLDVDPARAVATDAYRLGIAELSSGPGRKVLFPAAKVRHLPTRLLATETLRLIVGDRHVAWAHDGLSVVACTIDGEFPNYRNLVPNATATNVTVGREALALATRRAESVLSSAESTPVRLEVGEQAVEVIGSRTDVGVVTERVDAIIEGPSVRVACNPEFLRSGLDSLRADEVAVGLVDSLKPIVFREPGLLYLLMPVRVS